MGYGSRRRHSGQATGLATRGIQVYPQCWHFQRVMTSVLLAGMGLTSCYGIDNMMIYHAAGGWSSRRLAPKRGNQRERK